MGFNSGFKGLMRSHLDRYWGILPSGCNVCCTWTGTEEYCRADAMCVAPGVISSTAVKKKQQNLLCWLPRGTDRSSLLDFQFWECRVRDGRQVIKLHITIKQSDPNNDAAYKDWQRFQLKIIFQLKIMFLGRRDLHRFQLKGVVLGNRNISSLRFRGLDYRSRSEFKLP